MLPRGVFTTDTASVDTHMDPEDLCLKKYSYQGKLVSLNCHFKLRTEGGYSETDGTLLSSSTQDGI